MDHTNPKTLANWIRQKSSEMGFAHTAFSNIDLGQCEERLLEWLAAGFHGEMSYMEIHGKKRTRPSDLVPNTVSVITVRLDYLHQPMSEAEQNLNNRNKGYISRYALGRDYHKIIRKRLQNLATIISEHVGKFGYRAFCDSAPVMEKALAEKSGQGWLGKHTNILNREGSWFFLGELYTDLPLPADEPVTAHCGSCTACIDICPTGAIIAPYVLDARKCISYLTIELHGPIPEEYREAMGNRVYGCDDCQLCCPWNKYAKLTTEQDFKFRHDLDNSDLLSLFLWDEKAFENKTEGSAIRRIGYERWLRNVAVGLGNAPFDKKIVAALLEKADHPSQLVREHVQWALNQQNAKKEALNSE